MRFTTIGLCIGGSIIIISMLIPHEMLRIVTMGFGIGFSIRPFISEVSLLYENVKKR